MHTVLTKLEKSKKLRTLLVKSVNAHLKKGGKLISGGFEDRDGYCPIGIATLGVDELDFDKKLSKKLGFRLTDKDMWSFIFGFDGGGKGLLKDKDPFVSLGAALRKKYAKNIKRNI